MALVAGRVPNPSFFAALETFQAFREDFFIGRAPHFMALYGGHMNDLARLQVQLVNFQVQTLDQDQEDGRSLFPYFSRWHLMLFAPKAFEIQILLNGQSAICCIRMVQS